MDGFEHVRVIYLSNICISILFTCSSNFDRCTLGGGGMVRFFLLSLIPVLPLYFYRVDGRSE